MGGGFFFADGRLFTTDANLLFVDIVRILDDIDFRLKAGLIGAVGDARITKPGLIGLKTRVDGIMGPLKRAATIDDYTIDIPVLEHPVDSREHPDRRRAGAGGRRPRQPHRRFVRERDLRPRRARAARHAAAEF